MIQFFLFLPAHMLAENLKPLVQYGSIGSLCKLPTRAMDRTVLAWLFPTWAAVRYDQTNLVDDDLHTYTLDIKSSPLVPGKLKTDLPPPDPEGLL